MEVPYKFKIEQFFYIREIALLSPNKSCNFDNIFGLKDVIIVGLILQ